LELGRQQNENALFAVVFLGFFTVGWLFPVVGQPRGAELSIEAMYFSFLLFIAGMVTIESLRRLGWEVYRSRYYWIYGAAFLVCLLSATWSINPLLSLRETVGLLFPILIFVIASNYEGPADLAAGMRKVIVALFVASLLSLGIAMLRGQFDRLWILFGEVGITDIEGVFVLGVIAVTIALFFAIARIANGLSGPGDWVVALLAVGYLILTYSKSYLLAAMIGVMALYVLRSSPFKAVLIIVVSLGIFAATLVTDNPVSRSLFWDPGEVSLEEIAQAGSLSELPVNSSGRFPMWDYAVARAADSRFGLLLGVGWGASRWIMVTSPFGESYVHGDYVRILVEFGVVGLVAYLMLMFGVILKYQRMIKNSTDPYVKTYASVLVMILVYALASGVTYETVNKFRTLHVAIAVLVAEIGRRLSLRGYSGRQSSTIEEEVDTSSPGR
jgi:hypothetical protein